MKGKSTYRNYRICLIFIFSAIFFQIPFSDAVMGAPYVATIASPGQIAAGNICSGTTKAAIFSFVIMLDNGTGITDLTGLNFNTTGTYQTNELDSFFLWYNITNDLNSASLVVKSLDLVSGPQTFPAFTKTLVINDTSFFWITTNTLQAAANRTIQVSTMDMSNFTMADGTKIGTTTAGGLQTIIQTVSVPTGTATQSFCSAAAHNVSNLAATGSNIKWYAASTGGSALTGGTLLTTNTHYFATQTVNGCESTSRFDVLVIIVATPSAPTGNSTQTFCTTSSHLVSDLTATGTAILWYAAASGGVALGGAVTLVNGTHYFASQTVNGCESTSRFDVTVTLVSNPAAPTGNASQSFCSSSGAMVSNLTATGTAIQWYAASSGGVALAGNTPLVNGTHYFASQTIGGCESNSRLDVTVTIVTNPSAPTGNAAQTFCSGINPTVNSLTATGTTIQWYAASTGGSALTGGTALVNGTHYFATQTVNSCESTSRFDVTVTIVTTPLAPTGTAGQTFCSVSNPIVSNLAATGTVIQWYAASTGGSALSAGTALVNGTHYFASQTVNGCESILRFEVTVTIISNPAAPTGSSSQSFCSASLPAIANLTATGTAIQWYAAASGGTPLASVTPLVNGTHYFATQTINGCESNSRFDVTVTIIPNPSAPAGNISQSFCSATNSTISNLTATGTAIQWYAAATGGSALAAGIALVNGTHYFASQTVNGCESTSRFDVTVTIIPTPNAPTGNSAQAFCSVSNPNVGNLSATGTAIQWYAASTGGSTLGVNTPITNNTHYFATQTVNGCESVLRFDVTVTVITTPNAPSGNASQSFCSATNPTVANLSAAGTAIQWYATSSGGAPLTGATALTNSTHYFASQTVNSLCESTARFDVTVTIIPNPPVPTGSASQLFCGSANPTLINVSATGTTIQWYAVASGGSPLASNTTLNNLTHYFATQTVNGCESTTRLDVTASVRTLTTSAGSNAAVCAGLPATLSAINVSNGFPPYSVTWDNSAGGCSSVLENGTCTVQVVPPGFITYTATVTDLQSCSTTIAQTINVNPLPPNDAVINPVENQVELNVCAGSGNLAYALNTSSTPNVTWTSIPSSVSIGDVNAINNIITFPDSTVPYDATINIQVLGANGCTNSQSITVHVSGSTSPVPAAIVEKNIGQGPILVYTDPSVRGFRWGYDSVAVNKILKSAFIPGQVYQAFIPSSQFSNGSVLDTVKYWYWVMVYDLGANNDTCKTKVYYNGIFLRQGSPEIIPDDILAIVAPNPNDGNFILKLQGSIYGNINVRIIDMLGRVQSDMAFIKTDPKQNFDIHPEKIAAGLYSVLVTGENGEKVVVKCIVKN